MPGGPTVVAVIKGCEMHQDTCHVRVVRGSVSPTGDQVTATVVCFQKSKVPSFPAHHTRLRWFPTLGGLLLYRGVKVSLGFS